jgi:hypothetical protein
VPGGLTKTGWIRVAHAEPLHASSWMMWVPADSNLVEKVAPVAVAGDPPPDHANDVTVPVMIASALTNTGWTSTSQALPLHTVSWMTCAPETAKLVENFDAFPVAGDPPPDQAYEVIVPP